VNNPDKSIVCLVNHFLFKRWENIWFVAALGHTHRGRATLFVVVIFDTTNVVKTHPVKSYSCQD
jgi:hypothetical protein